MHIEILQKIKTFQIDKSDQWIAEARFGFDHIAEYCEKLPAGANVLEIGCGSGILLASLCNTFQQLSFEGIEPFSDGFSSLLELNQLVKESGVAIKNLDYERFDTKERFDLIYCINVFEHLSDWRHFISHVPKWLNDEGRIVILCPNYGFPYESHFRIPIIGNKKITYKLFGSVIDRFEHDEDCHGLWKSLNFIKKRELFRYIDMHTKLHFRDDVSIIERNFKQLFYRCII